MKEPSIHLTIHRILFALIFLATGIVGAADGRHALIIGIGQYSEASNTRPLLGVPQDMVNARRMAKEMGIPEPSIVMIRDDQATKANIQQELQKLAVKVQAGDRVFIYHSGHGTRYSKGKNCLQGLQTYTTGPFTVDDILTDEEIASYTKPISEKADKVVVMIDACFSGGVINPATRSLSERLAIRPKFNNFSDQQCENVGVNQTTTRSLLGEMTRLGINEENFVQIAAARENEVSWDTQSLGGLATHTLTQCLAGDAIDLNRSGAVSLEEVRACAQAKLNTMMKPHEKAGLLPSTIQVRGNRNLIPVVVQSPPSTSTVATAPIGQETVTTTSNSSQAAKEPVLPPPAPELPNQLTAITLTTPTTPPNAVTTPARPDESKIFANHEKTITPNAPVIPAAEEPLSASLATLKDIEQQRNPKRQVDVKVAKSTMRIGRDALELSIKSSHDGYVYLVLLGSDAKSFYVLYPNGLDKENRIKAGKPLQLPKSDWQIKAAGPVGTDNILVMVSDSPRKLDKLTMAEPTAAEPFTYALNDIGGRAALINFLTGNGIDGRSEIFGAKIVSVKEVQ